MLNVWLGGGLGRVDNFSPRPRGAGGGLRLPMKKWTPFSWEPGEGVSGVVYEQMSAFSHSQPSPQPPLSLRELFQSQRDKHCSRSERGAWPSNYQQPLGFSQRRARRVFSRPSGRCSGGICRPWCRGSGRARWQGLRRRHACDDRWRG